MRENSVLFYISTVDFAYSRSATFLLKQDARKEIIKGPIAQQINQIRRLSKIVEFKTTKFVVMSPSHVLVPILRICGARQIVLDAGWPLSDSTSSRNGFSTLKQKIVNNLIDLISFWMSNKVIVESPQQKVHVVKKFLIPKYKVIWIYTGVSKNRFDLPHKRPKFLPKDIQEENYILFRGKCNKEAGIENIIKSYTDSNINLKLVIATNKQPLISPDSDVIVLTGHLSDEEIAWLYKNSVFTLGQFGSADRLNRTIPHKFFEAAWFNKPYITPKREPLLDLLGEDYPFWFRNWKEILEVSDFRYESKTLQTIDSEHLQRLFIEALE